MIPLLNERLEVLFLLLTFLRRYLMLPLPLLLHEPLEGVPELELVPVHVLLFEYPLELGLGVPLRRPR